MMIMSSRDGISQRCQASSVSPFAGQQHLCVCTPWVLKCQLLVSSPIRCLGRHGCHGLFSLQFFLSNFSLEKLKCSDFASRYILCTVLLRTFSQGYPNSSAGEVVLGGCRLHRRPILVWMFHCLK